MTNTTAQANELTLYTVNDGHIYENVTMPILRRLAKRVDNATYEADKAHKAFYNLATWRAKQYHRELGSFAGLKWYQEFPVESRNQCAAQLLDYYLEYINEIAEERNY